ncbi:zinc finger protein ZIC 5-like [Carcharodon carcharias]|uniref:zinc finger protein ZIC 5-like n=1 Tax=Carcharodon carcharias TaxID=13397 RepID=UPI001B7F76A9|nr:zinc finger protein ZIC 5-like [Carcharodon carcharias]
MQHPCVPRSEGLWESNNTITHHLTPLLLFLLVAAPAAAAAASEIKKKHTTWRPLPAGLRHKTDGQRGRGSPPASQPNPQPNPPPPPPPGTPGYWRTYRLGDGEEGEGLHTDCPARRDTGGLKGANRPSSMPGYWNTNVRRGGCEDNGGGYDGG